MSKTRITRVGIVNVTGYAGVELARLLSRHTKVELTSISGRSAVGRKLSEVFPHLADVDLTLTAELGEVDIAFLALPHRESAEEAIKLLNNGVKVIDLSADFRLKDAALYPEWYGFSHPAPDLLKEAVYGLPELYRKEISSARLIANPGCYPTSVILGLAPVLKAGVVGTHIIVDSKSGVSGSGRSLSLSSHYAEANEDVTAYAIEGHRHLPEMQQEIARFMHNVKPVLTFIPHLVPMTRGILTTIYAPLSGKLETSQNGIITLKQIYKDFYKDDPFVRVSVAPPHTGHTSGSNMCLVYPTIDLRTGRMIVVSVLDNLVKGAAGQAIQNMNLMLGLDERTGLEARAVWP
jgi:N-acetyl-gamma-glutamyl-phosphate reductase